MRFQVGARLATVAAMGLMTLLSACNDTSFKSQNPKRGADVTVKEPDRKSSDATLKLACEDGKGDAHLVTDLKGTEATMVQLEGEFCGIPAGTSTGKLTMLFVVDFSGSMIANDPLVSGSCGRLAAAKAIVTKLEAQSSDNVEIKVGLNPFGASALPGIAPVDLAAFKAQLTPEALCRDDGGDTNYEAAFVAANDTLKATDGQKVVYFISDGLPTSSGTGPLGGIFADETQVYAAGRKAAETLRELQNLTLNTIFVGGSTPGGATSVDPQTYLEQITGDKAKVRVVANAEDLAAEILKFDTPDAVALDPDSVAGTVSASAFGKNDIKVASLTLDPAREGVWLFVTEPFALFGDRKKAVDNDVTLTVRGADGKDYKATAVIKFAMDAE